MHLTLKRVPMQKERDHLQQLHLPYLVNRLAISTNLRFSFTYNDISSLSCAIIPTGEGSQFTNVNSQDKQLNFVYIFLYIFLKNVQLTQKLVSI